jgi:glutathione S-transferase
MYAPVVSRFVTYGIAVGAESRRYMEAVQSHRAYGEWREAALKEPWVL